MQGGDDHGQPLLAPTLVGVPDPAFNTFSCNRSSSARRRAECPGLPGGRCERREETQEEGPAGPGPGGGVVIQRVPRLTAAPALPPVRGRARG